MSTLELNLSYIGKRLRIIREDCLLKKQNEMADALNDRYNQPNLFSQPRIYQIEKLGSLGKKALNYIGYLGEIGFNTDWIIVEENKELPMMADNSSSKEGSDIKKLLKKSKSISKNCQVLNIEIDSLKIRL